MPRPCPRARHRFRPAPPWWSSAEGWWAPAPPSISPRPGSTSCCSSATRWAAVRPRARPAACAPSSPTRSTSSSPSAASPRFGTSAAGPAGRSICTAVGYLFVLSQARDVDAFAASVALQNEYGVPSRMLSADDARALCPLLAGEDILAAAFSPEDGYVTPEAVVAGYAFAARRPRRRAARPAARCTGSSGPAAAITGVQTSAGAIETDTVICAAGAWSAALRGDGRGRAAGHAAAPADPVHRGRCPGCRTRLPMTIDFASSMYFHREGPGLLVGHVGSRARRRASRSRPPRTGSRACSRSPRAGRRGSRRPESAVAGPGCMR